MGFYMITFPTVTPAQRGEGILHKAGYRCSLQRTPRWMEAKGCGYSLRVQCEQIAVVIQLLQEKNIQFRKVYRRETDGTMKEVEL